MMETPQATYQIPGATYRIQFNPDFGFAAARDVVPYLAKLGISHFYASPIFAARKGSRHGYDIVDPNQLNPALGNRDDFDALVSELHQSGLLYIQDIVPNHLAYDSDNWMLMDVLETGSTSVFRHFFDIQWSHRQGDGAERILAPFLARPYHECLPRGEIRLVLDEAGLGITYSRMRLPVRIGSYPRVLGHGLDLPASDDAGREVLEPLVATIRTLEDLLASTGISDHYEGIPRIKRKLWHLYRGGGAVREHIDRTLDIFNRSGALAGRNLLDDLLSEQRFRLAYFGDVAREVNYRRFFTINRLISVNIQLAPVFDYLHRLVFDLVDAGKISGLRIDHIDGLYDPAEYLEQLRARAGNAYMVVEKILGRGEDLPSGWQVDGTTGYDFLNHLSGLFCDSARKAEFDELYARFSGITPSYKDLVYDSKRLILERYMTSETGQLARLSCEVIESLEDRSTVTEQGLRDALIEVIACFPVYRTYAGPGGLSQQDAEAWRGAIKEAGRRRPDLDGEVRTLEDLITRYSRGGGTEGPSPLRAYVMRLQQYTGPVMAKGFEDTALYRYNRLISLNEVGGDPGRFGVAIREFHAFNERRLASCPSSISTTSTHDTKRGEDARARINVLSEIPAEWEARLNAWRDLNRHHAINHEGSPVPDPNLEYLLYQTLVGAYPLDPADHDAFVHRVRAFTVKAAREAKTHTSWDRPDADYEQALAGFMTAILEASRANAFLDDFLRFMERIAHYGILNSLSQTLLKIAAPGVPDFYQGNELWNLSLVDPDNRRPVDFSRREAQLDRIIEAYQEDPLGTIGDLTSDMRDGRVKLFLTYRALLARKERIAIFSRGSYIPLEVSGRFSRHVIAFARSLEETSAVVVAPRLLAGLVKSRELPLGDGTWKDTEIAFPATLASRWQDAITGQVLATEGTLRLGDVLKHFPVALLLSKEWSR